MKRKNITTEIGVINLGDIQFCENELDVFIGIESVSTEVQKKIDEAVEIAKADHIQRVKEYYTNKNLNWTDKGVKTELSLHITVKDRTFAYCIEIDVADQEDDRFWTGTSVEVDLSDYQNELEKAIIKAMIDTLF